jgi:hypothetical protein
MLCESTDFIYPLLVDVYYPIVEVGGYGNLKKQWVLDRTISCFFGPAGRKYKEDITTNANISIDTVLIGRVRNDLTQSENESYSMTNVVLANIRDAQGNSIYNESAGIRSGKSTIFEIATSTPIVGPFGGTEYYNVVIRRSENQAVDV